MVGSSLLPGSFPLESEQFLCEGLGWPPWLPSKRLGTSLHPDFDGDDRHAGPCRPFVSAMSAPLILLAMQYTDRHLQFGQASGCIAVRNLPKFAVTSSGL